MMELLFKAPFQCEYKGCKPDEILHIPSHMIEENKMKKWFINYKKQIFQELTCDKIVWMALLEGDFSHETDTIKKLMDSHYKMTEDVVWAIKKRLSQ